ncbi:hypothetical protein CLV46_3225 [Diaminobutyricimonas aerilata]|uniref:Uncharacterized protein n=1 Tax=Diaminobutyricimonas aerilata TaxID=1162967 RepID=A0A2M9CP04_9MICO|nr:hypothetical protein [Diaminobutyricimonas aerilata]PJJ73631.1 hypothetical protein CLV46_3225 [Diaminobutyricimonas aerilata]
MDYDTATQIWFWALVMVAPIVVAGAAVIVGKRGALPRARMLHFAGGVVAAILLAIVGPWIAHALNPPPYDPAFAGGRGLDLRGFSDVIGAWAGAALTFAVTVVAAAAFALQAALRTRRLRRAVDAEG